MENLQTDLLPLGRLLGRHLGRFPLRLGSVVRRRDGGIAEIRGGREKAT